MILSRILQAGVLIEVPCSKAPFVYEDDSGRVAQLLWEEMMAEPAFAQAEDILRELSNYS